MKRFFLLLLLASATTFGLQAQTPAAAAPAATTEVDADGPQMTFEAVEVDYGTIAQDSEPFRVFKFTNTGSEPALILNARGSCGCTVPSYSKAPVAPGESSEIKVRYDTHRIGQFRKRVTLTTNVPGDPIVLTIKGKVEPKAAEPAAVPAGEDGMFKSGGK
ncbi:DUF1573 domain-containing protein [Lewinella sp. 4G2]|uniref:DUF1573 domain-containing protein n=1 Tax=Lewinella sp. 4G2 TaxID=1803372 RepID=UPI0007B4E301|nr:DUF1573 domain-containing protein [Lewinella sp. 4G2]OAV44612.1 hypothetical protein A3850_008955 [Lewinella sp. 4G2]